MSEDLDYIRSAKIVRERAYKVFTLIENDQSQNFSLDLTLMQNVAKAVCETTRESYPNFDVPYHSRWRHFELDGELIWQPRDSHKQENASANAFADVIVSVLVDAGAGMEWKFQREGKLYSKSEGLALASLDLIKKLGDLSAETLTGITEDVFKEAFQVSENNPLVGIKGRCQLLANLGKCVAERPEIFVHGKLDDFFAYVTRHADSKRIPAESILRDVLTVFSNVWPSRQKFAGHNLGDVWEYAGLSDLEKFPGLMPFHKLSQWLTYSLLEPLEWCGYEITDLDSLTGLPEYRNGGLFIDYGVLVPKNSNYQNETYKPESEFIVEWRAATVVLLDKLAAYMRENYSQMRDWPLAKFLQGGSWTTGRKIAKAKRQDGGPPINIDSDGTVF